MACAVRTVDQVLRNWDATSLNRGPFLYASGDDIDLGSIVKISYGREATVAVRRDESGSTLLQIDGKIDATSGGDTATQTCSSPIHSGPAECAPATRPRHRVGQRHDGGRCQGCAPGVT